MLMNLFKTAVVHICCIIFFMGAAFETAVPPASAASAAEAEADEVLRLFYWQTPTVFNPYLASGNKDREICRIVYEPLASPNADGTLIPILAEKIPTFQNYGLSEDGKSVIWKLKPGVRWSDGQPFTAEDVIFTWQFITDPNSGANGKSAYNTIKSVEMTGPLTVKIIFHGTNPAWDVPFVGKEGMILPRHIFEKYRGENFRQLLNRPAEVGTGPYRMRAVDVKESILVGEDIVNIIKIIFEPNPFFREKGRPFFKRLELHGGGGALMAARAVLKHGSADYAWNLQADSGQLAEMEKTGRGKLIYEYNANTEKILLNFTEPGPRKVSGGRHPFFSQKKVRQAFAHAVNRKAIAALYGHYSPPAFNTVIMPKIYQSPDTPEMYPYDLKRSAALFDESGWKDSDDDGIRDKDGIVMRVRFQTSVNRIRQETQRIVKRDLESIGVEVSLKMIDAGIFFGKNNDPNHFMQFQADMEAYSSGNLTRDPASYLMRWICDQKLAGLHLSSFANFSGYCSPAFDSLFRRQAKVMDSMKRRTLLIRMNKLLIEDVALIPLVRRTRVHAVSGTLDHVDITPWDFTTWNIGDWRRKD